jgi:hypothetical protein
MTKHTKYVEVKLCNSCRISINYRKFRTGATVDEIRKVADFYEKLLKVK